MAERSHTSAAQAPKSNRNNGRYNNAANSPAATKSQISPTEAGGQTPTRPRVFYQTDPNFEKSFFEVPEKIQQRLLAKLGFLYGNKAAGPTYNELERLMRVHWAHKSTAQARPQKFDRNERFSERDTILICYGDMIRAEPGKSLELLAQVSQRYFLGLFNTLHILALFPYSSDRGFAITDFEQVNPEIGSWKDVRNLSRNFRLIVDGVFNHLSSRSRWFMEFRNQNPSFQNFFIAESEISKEQLRRIVRPRTSALLSRVSTLNGRRQVWTTFGPDQIDLNFRNPEVLLKIVEILLLYVRGGADTIRLDAINYVWKELGTACVHLQEAHMIVKLLRDVLDAVATTVSLLTETNVPHQENISYFGNGFDEAQMVYNFALPPLVLHAFQMEDATKLAEWASSLQTKSTATTFLNFLDSHDGIGVSAVRGILSVDEIAQMAKRVLDHGGLISYRSNSHGESEPYELNATWFSAINHAGLNESQDQQVKRYLASRSIALAMKGVPAVYMDGLLGAKNNLAATKNGGYPRDINRQTTSFNNLLAELDNQSSNPDSAFARLATLIKSRSAQKVFHPNAEQRVLNGPKEIFALLRTSTDKQEYLIALTNVSSKKLRFKLDTRKLGLAFDAWHDLLSNQSFLFPRCKLSLTLEAYDVKWLKAGLARKINKKDRNPTLKHSEFGATDEST